MQIHRSNERHLLYPIRLLPSEIVAARFRLKIGKGQEAIKLIKGWLKPFNFTTRRSLTVRSAAAITARRPQREAARTQSNFSAVGIRRELLLALLLPSLSTGLSAPHNHYRAILRPASCLINSCESSACVWVWALRIPAVIISSAHPDDGILRWLCVYCHRVCSGVTLGNLHDPYVARVAYCGRSPDAN
jgi:hypothetical protein